MKLYAGIGSRDTPPEILELMTLIARHLSLDYILRSGGAKGADTAFEKGSNKSEIFLPWAGYNDSKSEFIEPSLVAIELAASVHPNWRACSPGARKLHGRNAHIVLGVDLNTPVEFVICWTKDGKDSGGTGLAMRLANHLNIPVYNLHNENTRRYFISMISEDW